MYGLAVYGGASYGALGDDTPKPQIKDVSKTYPLQLLLLCPEGAVELLPGTVVPAPGSEVTVSGDPYHLMITALDGAAWEVSLVSAPPVVLPDFDPVVAAVDTTYATYATEVSVAVYDQTNTELIGVLSAASSKQWLDELNGVGGGQLKVPVGHPDTALLERDRVLRFSYHGQERFAAVIEKRMIDVIAEPGSAYRAVQGRSLMCWLEDGVVYPWGGLNRWSPDVRPFNYGSSDARYYPMSGDGTWVQAVGVSQNVMHPLFPENWADPYAQWIWAANPMQVPDQQACWVRREFTTVLPGSYRIQVSGDNGYTCWVDGIEVANVGYDTNGGFSWGSATEATLDLQPGNHVVAIRGQNLNRWPGSYVSPAGVICSIYRLGSDQKPLFTVVRTDSSWQATLTAPGWYAGTILWVLLHEAKARGVTRLLALQPTFSPTHDSTGKPWTTVASKVWDVGTSLLSVAWDLCELGVNVWITPDNRIHCTETRDPTISSVRLVYGETITGYSTEETFAGSSVAVSKLANGWAEIAQPRASRVLKSRRESALSLQRTDSDTETLESVKKALESIAVYSATATCDTVLALDGSRPYIDCNIGNTARAYGPDGKRRSVRVLSMSVVEDAAGNVQWTPELDVWTTQFTDDVLYLLDALELAWQDLMRAITDEEKALATARIQAIEEELSHLLDEDAQRALDALESARQDYLDAVTDEEEQAALDAIAEAEQNLEDSQDQQPDDPQQFPPDPDNIPSVDDTRNDDTSTTDSGPGATGDPAGSSGAGGGSGGRAPRFRQKERILIGPKEPSPESGFQLWVDVKTAEGSAYVETVPGAPTDVAAVGGLKTVTIEWYDPEEDGYSPITGYKIEYQQQPSGSWAVLIADTSSTALIAQDVAIATPGTYKFRVSAINKLGTGPASTESPAVSVYGLPGKPTAVTATAGVLKASLTWTAPVDTGQSTISYYKVEKNLSSEPAWTTVSEQVSGVELQDIKLDKAGDYRFRVTAINEAGPGDASDASGFVHVYTVPGAVTQPNAYGGNGLASVSWAPPEDDGNSNILGYRVDCSSGDVIVENTAPSISTSYGNIALQPGDYTFRVTAINAAGAGLASPDSTTASVYGLPAAPSGVTATGGVRSASVEWSPPSNTGNSPITQYLVEGQLQPAGSWQTLTTAGSTSASVSLSAGYWKFRVTAVNAAGSSPASGSSSAVRVYDQA